MKTLLTTLNAKYIHMNLAIRLLYDLNQEHEGLEWKEFTIKEDPEDIAAFCSEFEVVAFSCYIWNITQTLVVARKIKELNPHTKIMLGGPEVSYEWTDVIIQPEVDYIILGEGEIPFSLFINQYPHIKGIPNLVWKEGDDIRCEKETLAFDLKNYTGRRPYAYDPPEDLYNKVCYIETSRGCPYKCEFCLASLDNKVRYLPIDDIKANLLYLMNHARTIKFLDRTFNVKRDFTLDIFDFILKHHRPGNIFQFEITADIVHPDIISFIKERVPKGLFRFEIGIQTLNQKANLEVSRKQQFDKTKAVILQLRDAIEMHLDLIVGLPLDYFEDIKYSFEEVFKLYPPELQLGFLKFLKGTPVREKHEAHGFVFDPLPPYQIIKSNYLSEIELQKIVQLEGALEIYWNKKRTPNTLIYITSKYSIFDFLMNLGAYFETRKAFHQYTLSDIFVIMRDFITANYNDDRILKELLVVDYCMQYKTNPGEKFVEGLDGISIEKIRDNGRTSLTLPISFDLEKYISSYEVEEKLNSVCFVFSGVKKPTIEYI